MSVYKRKGATTYIYDFYVKRRRFTALDADASASEVLSPTPVTGTWGGEAGGWACTTNPSRRRGDSLVLRHAEFHRVAASPRNIPHPIGQR